MKILLLTISDQQQHPLRKHTDLHRSFDFRSWESGLTDINPDVYIFDYFHSYIYEGPFMMENRIRELVRKNNIELLIVPNLYFEITHTFLSELRNYACKSLIVFFDDSIRFEKTNRFFLNSFDYYLTHESKQSQTLYKPYGVNIEFFPNLPSYTFYKKILERNGEMKARGIDDVVFIGAKIADRSIFINHLKKHSISVSTYGNGWENGMLPTEEMIVAFNKSKISLNFVKSIDGSGQTQLKGRLFEIIMAGGFVLSEYCDELADYFDIGNEIDTFQSPEDLLDKVRFYLKHDKIRDKMAAKAKEKVKKHYSFESNWKYYLSKIKNGTLKSSRHNSYYNIPASAINTFLRWNISFIKGRFLLGQYGLAFQHYKFCKRELKNINKKHSILKFFFKAANKSLIKMISSNILNK